MEEIKSDIKKIITIKLISWALKICPPGQYRNELAIFIVRNTHKL